jgi:DNA-binding response OmpR family regulator
MQPQEELPDELQFADVVVDFRRYEASRLGRAVELTRKEFGVLRILAARVGEVVQRSDLLNHVWGYQSSTSTRTVDNHIASLRAKLEMNPADPKHLLTVHGVGYKLTIS